ncbi:hypothetical protein [Pyrobaculum aerophilum]|uniref:hypothetical protein n=1 Tax=Pyrobaculum aerophilum TaxID=13773 RepID=UPI002FD8827E
MEVQKVRKIAGIAVAVAVVVIAIAIYLGNKFWERPEIPISAINKPAESKSHEFSNKTGRLYIYLEDDGGPVNASVFILPAYAPNASAPGLIKAVELVNGRGVVPQHVVDALMAWAAKRVGRVGVMIVVVNKSDVVVTTASVDPREAVKTIGEGRDYEIRAKVRGKIKEGGRGYKAGGYAFAACPEAQMVKEDEFQTGMMPVPLFRVNNIAGVYGTFSIGLASIYEKRFSFGIALQEDVADLVNISLRIEPYAYTLGAQYSGARSSAIPPAGRIYAIYLWMSGRYEVYRIEYYAADVSGCLLVDQDWLYRVYPNGVQTSGNTIVMGVADVTDTPDAQVVGSTTILYRSYTGTGSQIPQYNVQVSELAGWFYQECPGSLTAPDVGAGVDLGKKIIEYAKKVGKVLLGRVAKIVEMVGIDVAWTGGTQTFVVLGDASFDAAWGKTFSAYFYTTQAKVEVPSCGKVDLPFLYIEFR